MATQEDPAVGSLPGETITYGRNLLGAPTRTSGIELQINEVSSPGTGITDRTAISDVLIAND